MSGSPFIFAISHGCVVDINQEPYRALTQAGARVRLVAPEKLNTDVRGEIGFKALEGVEVSSLPLRSGGYSRLAGGQRGIHLIVYDGLEAIIGAARPDLIYAEEEPFSLAARQISKIADGLKIPFVFHANQNVAKKIPYPFRRIRSSVFSIAKGATVRNNASAELLALQGFQGPTELFPHAVDLSRYSASERLDGLRSPVIGFVGRLVPEKGVAWLIDSLASAREALGGRGSLLVVGDGPERQALEKRAADKGIPAKFLGSVAHDIVPGLYSSMDLVCIPSLETIGWKEQFGRIVIEANAAGVPVVTSDTGELPATVASTGGGVVVPEGDVSMLAQAIERLARDDLARKDLGDMGRRGVAMRFTPEAVARRLLAFFQSILH